MQVTGDQQNGSRGSCSITWKGGASAKRRPPTATMCDGNAREVDNLAALTGWRLADSLAHERRRSVAAVAGCATRSVWDKLWKKDAGPSHGQGEASPPGLPSLRPPSPAGGAARYGFAVVSRAAAVSFFAPFVPPLKNPLSTSPALRRRLSSNARFC